MIDKKSQRLIKRVNSGFVVRKFQFQMAIKIMAEFLIWFNDQDPYQLRDKLVSKMSKGAEEHGNVSKKQAKKELEEEYLDLFGWTFKIID